MHHAWVYVYTYDLKRKVKKLESNPIMCGFPVGDKNTFKTNMHGLYVHTYGLNGMFPKISNLLLFSFLFQLDSKLNDEYGGTVPSRPHNIGVEGAADLSSHGTTRKLHKVEDVDTSEGLCFLHLICGLTFFQF